MARSSPEWRKPLLPLLLLFVESRMCTCVTHLACAKLSRDPPLGQVFPFHAHTAGHSELQCDSLRS